MKVMFLGTLGLLACAAAACSAEDPVISLGALDDAGDFQPSADAEPGAPDAHPGTPDAHVQSPPDAMAMPESLQVSFVTTPNGGNYAPRNIVAVWVEGPGGAFVKTIGRWAGTRRSHLVAWVQKSGSDADAVSGATRSNHNGTLTVTWDFKNRSGQLVPDGTYTIRMELADGNSFIASQNHQGTFTLNKNGTGATQMTSGGGFNNVSITYSGR